MRGVSRQWFGLIWCWGLTGVMGRRRAAQRPQSFSSRIVGGHTARNGRYPYAQISLATETGLHQCGGSLIAPDVILTAGHCHGFFKQVRVNIYNIKSELESFQVLEAKRMHYHPQFDELWFRYDFLLLQLNDTVKGLDPVRLNSDDSLPIVGDSLTVVGWGLTDPEDSTAYPDTLKEVSVSYISNDSCEHTASKGQRLYQGYIFDDMLCAMEAGKDACSGDSGAPLILPGSTPDQDMVVAVVSWGNGCATDYPGVYARISYQFDWIRNIVCAISIAPPDYFECTDDNNQNQPTGVSNIPAPAPTPTLPVYRPTPVGADFDPTNFPDGHVPIKIGIQLDLHSKDTGWSLLSDNGNVVAEVEAGTYTTPYQLVEKVMVVPASEQFVFIIKDSEGDGICCEFGGGWFQVSLLLTDGSYRSLVKGYGTFSLSATNAFMTPADNTPILHLEGGTEIHPPSGVDTTAAANEPNAMNLEVSITDDQLELAEISSSGGNRLILTETLTSLTILTTIGLLLANIQ